MCKMEIESDPFRSLRLPADCSIAGIRDAHDLICTTLGSQDALEIDCSGVEKADVTAVQLLLSTAKTAQQQGCRLNLTAISPALQASIERAGIPSGAMGDQAAEQQGEPS
jgi:anti-anti-sigma regulatory factor